jgi:outer membrane protein W
MRRLQVSVLLAALFLMAPSPAHAQAKAGDKEVLISGSVFSFIQPGTTSTNGNLIFGLGYFVTDRTQLLVQPIFTISSQGTQAQAEVRDPFTGRVLIPGQAGSTSFDVDAGLGVGYQFFFGAQSSKVKPYLGADLDIQSFKTEGGGSVADNMYFQGRGGVKNYFSERAALDMAAAFGRQLKNSDLGLFRFTVGITYLF